jgi:SAM-dependent methyltransferase
MWAEDGIAAIDYAHSFYPELAPAHLGYALALAGFRPPVEPGAPFRYAELGCGQGLTTNLLAALHPEGRFESIDLLPSHMANATRLAEAAGLDNVRFAAESFADFAAQPGGKDFHIIALHGVWSWVGAANRTILADIAARRLKPGGALFVSYNCLPGWAADMPVRALLLEAVAEAQGPLPDRISFALEAVERLAAAGGYFDRVPSAAAHLRSLHGKADAYLAHEYLNRNWAPFYHADLAAALEPAGLSFAASATLLDHLPLPPAAQALLDAAGPARRETLRDTLLYTRFRRDIFIKTPERLSATERRHRLDSIHFGLTMPRADIPDSATTAMGELLVDTDLADCLAEAPRRGIDALPLCALGAAAALPPPDPARAERCVRFNAAVLEANRTDSAIRQLASPVLGTGLVVDLLDRLFLLAEQDGAPPAEFAWSILAGRDKRLRRDGAWLDGAEANLAEMRALYAGFVRARRGWLAQANIAR